MGMAVYFSVDECVFVSMFKCVCSYGLICLSLSFCPCLSVLVRVFEIVIMVMYL